jgi:hypothetical protein
VGIRFRKRIKILPGLHVNVSKSGTSLNIGPKGANISIGKKGVYANTGIPGTGIYSRERISKRNQTRSQNAQHSDSDTIKENPFIFIVIFLTLFLAIFIPFCGGSWWFLLIMPLLGIAIILIGGSIQEKQTNTKLALIKEQNEKNVAEIKKNQQKFTNRNKKPKTTIGSSINVYEKVKCSSCGVLNEPNFKYCRTCASELDIENAEREVLTEVFQYSKCPHCFGLSPMPNKNNKYCVRCGTENRQS